MRTASRPLGAVLLAGFALIAALLLVSGEEQTDPRTPPALPGMPAPFLGVAVLGDGGLTAAVDAYGNVVDLRAPGPAGPALIENPAERQAAGTVPAETGIQVWVRIGGSARPIWQADSIRQGYLPGMSVLRTVAQFGEGRVELLQAARGQVLAVAAEGIGASVEMRVNADLGCKQQRQGRVVTLLCSADRRDDGSPLDEVAAADRRWLQRSRPLGPTAPRWAEQMYERSLLVLRALTDRRNGAVAAGARDGWAYVWPRDAGAVAIAFAAAGYQSEAKRITRFLLGLDLEGTARFNGDGSPVPGRDAQGDEIGWVAAAAQAAGTIGSARHAAEILSQTYPVPWRERPDYWEGEPGDFLANAIASGESAERIRGEFGTLDGLAREAGGNGGLESAAAWAVRPFPRPALVEPARRTLLRLAGDAGRYGLLPGEGWSGGEDPWSAPTAWTAWSLAALGERSQALRLLGALRRSATPAGDLPERVDADTGIPRSTTPLAWSHAFAALALRELWPSR
ncbi:MAG TPA: hypothetical protein VD761_08705 [Solirubrobacterales bacterium]|nr:hypothetical protein [Solirubrobacterales bacterium]